MRHALPIALFAFQNTPPAGQVSGPVSGRDVFLVVGTIIANKALDWIMAWNTGRRAVKKDAFDQLNAVCDRQIATIAEQETAIRTLQKDAGALKDELSAARTDKGILENELRHAREELAGRDPAHKGADRENPAGG